MSSVELSELCGAECVLWLGLERGLGLTPGLLGLGLGIGPSLGLR